MVPSIYGENMFDEFFDNNGFFGSVSSAATMRCSASTQETS